MNFYGENTRRKMKLRYLFLSNVFTWCTFNHYAEAEMEEKIGDNVQNLWVNRLE